MTALAFKLSPWPSVAIFSYLFAQGDQASEARLAKHVPPGIVTRGDKAYGDGPAGKHWRGCFLFSMQNLRKPHSNKPAPTPVLANPKRAIVGQ